MGHGLGIKNEGTHVAFCGGTGIFVFVDLVAHLIRKYFDQLSSAEKTMINEKGFKFILYASFPNRTEALALDLVEKFDELCKLKKYDLFELRLRLSSETKQRWDEAYIKSQMKEIGNVERVWVCGPPIMNDAFMQMFNTFGKEVGVTKDMLDVM